MNAALFFSTLLHRLLAPANKHPRLLACGLCVLFAFAVAIAFQSVLPLDIIFVAPDAPVSPYTFSSALHHLFTSPPSLQNLILLFPPQLAYEGTFWVDSWVMCLAGLFLLRSRGYSWPAAWVGGFCAAFVGYFATLFCAGHRGVIDALAVTCLGFGVLARGIASPSPGSAQRWPWFLLLGGILAFGLGSQADIWLLVVCALGAYGLWLTSIQWHTHGRRILRPLLLCTVLTTATFVIVGLPALNHTFGAARAFRSEQLSHAQHTAASPKQAAQARWQFITDWSLPPEDLTEWILPGCRGHTSYPFDPAPYTGRMGSATQILRQHAIHVGWFTLLLALLAFFRKRSECPDRLFWTLLAGLTLLLALGRYTPCYQPIAAIPFLNQIRAPIKWLHLTGFALSMLAGIGADRFLRNRSLFSTWVLCGLIAANGILVIRPYVFPRDLSHNALTRSVPKNAHLFNAVHWQALDDICRWHNIPLASTLHEADVVVAPAPQPGRTPLATHTIQGITLGLYALKQDLSHD